MSEKKKSIDNNIMKDDAVYSDWQTGSADGETGGSDMYRADDAPKANVKRDIIDGMRVRTYTVGEGQESLFNVPTEQDIKDYEDKLRADAEAKFREREADMKSKIKADMASEADEADLNNADIDTLSKALGVSARGAADSVKLDPEQIQERLKQIVKDDRIVCIGDSITYGHQVDGSLTWIGRLRREEEINLLNVGLDGDTTSGMLTRFKEHVIDLEPKAVLIMGGGNDLFGGTPLDYVTNNIALMSQLALDNGIVPMVGVEPEPDHKKVPKEWKEFIDYDQACEHLMTLKEWLLVFAKANMMPIIDFDTGMKNKLKAGYGRYFMDGAHPNPAGHKIMAAIAKEAFIAMGILKEKQKPTDDRFAL